MKVFEPVPASMWPDPNQRNREFFFAVGNDVLTPDVFHVVRHLMFDLCADEARLLSDDFPAMLVEAGCFPSKGQARKAGGDIVLPDGLSLFVVGKLRTHLWIWKPVPNEPPRGDETMME